MKNVVRIIALALALVLLAAMIVLLVYVRHKENICRLIHGDEKRIVN